MKDNWLILFGQNLQITATVKPLYHHEVAAAAFTHFFLQNVFLTCYALLYNHYILDTFQDFLIAEHMKPCPNVSATPIGQMGLEIG